MSVRRGAIGPIAGAFLSIWLVTGAAAAPPQQGCIAQIGHGFQADAKAAGIPYGLFLPSVAAPDPSPLFPGFTNVGQIVSLVAQQPADGCQLP